MGYHNTKSNVISTFQCHQDLVDFTYWATILENSSVNIDFCNANENVYHDREGFKDDFFF